MLLFRYRNVIASKRKQKESNFLRVRLGNSSNMIGLLKISTEESKKWKKYHIICS